MEIKYFNRKKGEIEVEKVYGAAAVSTAYNTTIGRFFLKLITTAPISVLYGMSQSMNFSRQKIPGFVKKFEINLDEYEPEVMNSKFSSYSTFNSFFIRKFKKGVREFESTPSLMPAFCEARYFGFKEINDSLSFPVKGRHYKPSDFIKSEKWNSIFDGGPLMIARLCPVDYHRFHFPDDGKILDHYKITGPYHSVNPLAIATKENILSTNVREVTILETENFGKIAYIEVGAVCVGKIVQSHKGKSFKRGDEKGYFLFGGSTVVIIGEKGKWLPSEDILKNTLKGIETYLNLGEQLAEKGTVID